MLFIPLVCLSQLDKRISVLEDPPVEALKKQLAFEEVELIGQTLGSLIRLDYSPHPALEDFPLEGNKTEDPVLLKAFQEITSFPSISWYDKENGILDLTWRDVFLIGKIKIESIILNNYCVKSLPIENAENEVQDLCNCQLEQLAKKFTSIEIIALYKNALELNEMYEYKSPTLGIAQTLAVNEKFYDAVIHCFISKKEILDQITKSSQGVRATNEQITASAELHLNELKNQNIEMYNEMAKSVNMKNYSECYIKTMYNEFDYLEILGDDPEVTSRLEEIQLECMKNNKKQ